MATNKLEDQIRVCCEKGLALRPEEAPGLYYDIFKITQAAPGRFQEIHAIASHAFGSCSTSKAGFESILKQLSSVKAVGPTPQIEADPADRNTA